MSVCENLHRGSDFPFFWLGMQGLDAGSQFLDRILNPGCSSEKSQPLHPPGNPFFFPFFDSRQWHLSIIAKPKILGYIKSWTPPTSQQCIELVPKLEFVKCLPNQSSLQPLRLASLTYDYWQHLFFFFVCLGLYPHHGEVPRLGVKSEL